MAWPWARISAFVVVVLNVEWLGECWNLWRLFTAEGCSGNWARSRAEVAKIPIPGLVYSVYSLNFAVESVFTQKVRVNCVAVKNEGV